MLNPFKLMAIYRDLNKLEVVAKEKATMGIKIPQIVALLVQVLGFTGASVVAYQWVISHLLVIVVINGVLALGHALLPSIVPGPIASNPTMKVGAILLMIGMATMCTGRVNAQEVTPTPTPVASPTFTGSADAVAFHYKGQWGVGSLTTESLDFIDFGKTKSNHLFVEGRELVASTAGLNVYTGGVAIQPDLTKLLKKTNVSTANLSVSLNAGAGAGVPSSGGSHISFLMGGGLRYKATSALTWNALQAQYVRYGSTNSAAISTGLAFAFGK